MTIQVCTYQEVPAINLYSTLLVMPWVLIQTERQYSFIIVVNPLTPIDDQGKMFKFSNFQLEGPRLQIRRNTTNFL